MHNTGEIWATMLWECYASLLRDTQGPSPRLTFAEAQQRMKDYLVTGYKLTPNAPTLVEARDAVLTAAFANDPVDGLRFCEAFARRGAGTGAISPDRFSTTNSPVTESYICGSDLDFQNASLTVIAQCDGDAFLDNREVGRLSVTIRNVGGQPLTNTTATVTSSNASLSFPNGNTVMFPATTPFTSSTATIDVGMFGATGIQDVALNIAINDPALTVPGPINVSFSTAGNADSVLNSSATDDVESPDIAWAATKVGAGGVNFSRIELSAFDHRWFAPNAGQPADVLLTSPALQVGSGNFSFTFRHRFSFEAPLFDGGVLEISTNGGATWTDIGNAFASPGYNGTLVATGSNPIRGRRAWVNTMPGYPAFRTETVNLGTAFAGQTVHVRFRHGADDNTVSVGWDIDDIAFSGITNTPFATLVAQGPSACSAGRVIIKQVESVGGHNPTVNEWVELRNVSASAIDLIGLRICDDQSLNTSLQCDAISGHYVLDAGSGVVFAADKSVFLADHPGYAAARVLDDASDSFIGVDGLDNNGDGVHLFDPAVAASTDCMNYHNSSTCFAKGVVKDDGAESMQRSISNPAPKLREAWTRGPEILP